MAAASPTGYVVTHRPPRWLNMTVAALLRTPGLQRIVGRRLALLTFTGYKTGRSFTIPMSYDRDGDVVVLVTRAVFRWWRNLRSMPSVRLRLAGKEVHGRAEIHRHDPNALSLLQRYLEHRPAEARAYGLRHSAGDHLDGDSLLALLPQMVVVTVALDDA